MLNKELLEQARGLIFIIHEDINSYL